MLKDAKDLAVREIDKLMEHLPSRGHSRVITATTDDRKLAIMKSGPSTQSASLPSIIPPKSLLGHGPSIKQKGTTSRLKSYALTQRLLDQDVRSQVNDISPSVRYDTKLASSLTTVADHLSGGRPGLTKRSRTNSGSGSSLQTTPSATEEPPSKKTPASSAKRSSFYSSAHHERDQVEMQDLDKWESSSDRHQEDVESDLSDYLSTGGRRSRLSRESSATPSIVSLAGTMSISGQDTNTHRPHSRQRHEAQYRRQMHPKLPPSARYSLLGEILTRPELPPTISTPAVIYPGPPAFHTRSTSESRRVARVTPALDAPTTDSLDNPFVTSREPSPVPSSFADITTPDSRTRQTAGTSSPALENDTVNEMRQELAAIKQLVASLVSAREVDLHRANSSPAHLNSPPPAPPPPPSQGTPSTSKKWAPPVSQATQSMQNVLRQLSSSKVQLRKTGSPYFSRISSAVDSSDSSKYTSVAVRSIHEPKTPKDEDFNHLPKTPSKKSRLDPSSTHMNLNWPSPDTVQRADSRLDRAAEELATKQPTLLSRLTVLADEPEAMARSSSSSPSPSTVQEDTGAASQAPGLRNRNGVAARLVESHQLTTRPRYSPLQRSMTDPTQLNSRKLSFRARESQPVADNKHVSFQSLAQDHDNERRWYLESDTDGWRVSQ
ncbi:hypothetical protein KVV02_008308 [Mortierella alpina]|uniref:Uncharacterized protein n=1 Tax=Mortierella alpina TaxID=64518 RepID=A0A9P8CVI9_MORAP|nr:hypothetical protein KVV02_008308 [Mortierella alpina]